MNKRFTLPLMAFALLGMVGCTDTESIPSDNLYTTVSEKKMPYYCKHEISKEFGIYSGDIYLYPIAHERGARIIRGRYREDGYHLKEFACIFNNNDTYAGIKMQHSNIKNTLCYGK